MNAPDRLIASIVQPDEKKVTISTDDRMINTQQFTILKEDDTLGNVVRMQLLRDPKVKFAGYIQRHPLVNEIDVKIQTHSSPEDEYTPNQAFLNCLTSLRKQLKGLQGKIENAVGEYQDLHNS